MNTKPLIDWLHQGTTILGLAVIGGDVSGVLLGQFTPRQAVAAAITGIIAIAMRQVSGTTVVTGAMPVVNTQDTTIAPAAGSITTIK